MSKMAFRTRTESFTGRMVGPFQEIVLAFIYLYIYTDLTFLINALVHQKVHSPQNIMTCII